MAKRNKLQHFAENETFEHVFHPSFPEIFGNDYKMKGNWNQSFFKNNHPLIAELGCGKGEYTVGMAKTFPDRNFIGIDIKGARLWRGAKQVSVDKMTNAAFIRTRVDFITSLFAPNELSEIWLTFPDPQIRKKSHYKKRLSSSRFLNRYRQVLVENGIVNLKTDSTELYDYTLRLIQYNQITPIIATANLYEDIKTDEILEIKTFYEKKYIQQNIPIKYLRFALPKNIEIIELPDEEI